MPLYLALHTVEVVTAKVSLAMIMLVDHVKKATPPPELRCRGVSAHQLPASFGTGARQPMRRGSEPHCPATIPEQQGAAITVVQSSAELGQDSRCT